MVPAMPAPSAVTRSEKMRFGQRMSHPRKPILIVKAGGTYPDMAARWGDFEEMFVRRLDPSPGPVEMVCPVEGDALPALASLAGAIVTGSHDMVTDRHPWSEKTGAWIRRAVEADLPLLGVCYGHQLLAHALGGVVDDNPMGKEFGTVPIQCGAHAAADPLFENLSGGFDAQTCHSQSVLQLPAGAIRLAWSAMDPHHAFAVGKRAWGVQFHPEFNADVLREYIRRFADDLAAQGDDVGRLLAGVRETPESESLLRRFQRLCR